MPLISGRPKIVLEYAGYLFTLKELVLGAVAPIIFVGGLLGLGWTEDGVLHWIFALAMLAGALVCMFLIVLVLAEKWVAVGTERKSRQSSADVTVTIIGVGGRGEVGSVVPSVSGAGTVEAAPAFLNAAQQFVTRSVARWTWTHFRWQPIGGCIGPLRTQEAVRRRTHP